MSALPYEVIIADMVYLIVLLAHDRSITLFSARPHSKWTVGTDEKFLSGGALMDKKGNPLMNQNGMPQFKTPNPKVELPYTYLMA